jgi:hypothetical protein
MINLCGEMSNLGFPSLVKRLMRWAGKVTSMQGNIRRLLPDGKDRNDETYSSEESLVAFQTRAPGLGHALCGQIGRSALFMDYIWDSSIGAFQYQLVS